MTLSGPVFWMWMDGKNAREGERMRGVRPEGDGRKQLEVEKVIQPAVLL